MHLPVSGLALLGHTRSPLPLLRMTLFPVISGEWTFGYWCV